MLAGEGNGGADKVWAPTESMEPPALHQSLEGGEDSERDERNDYVRKAGNDEKVEGQRFGGKLCTKMFFCGCNWALGCDFIVATLYCMLKRKQCCTAARDSALVHIIFSLPRTSINNYTNNEVLIGEGGSHGQTSGPTGKSMA